ncbi:Persistence and stress-resistance toxin PasT [Thalassocella blandensis]|nr:Persistence and stress-resistance toxin PasT [Thalassocella blandensis]
MKRIERSALVTYSTEQMYDLVNDVEQYPKFIPGCKRVEILSQSESSLVARLELAKAGFEQSFVTRNTMVRPSSITLQLEEGPFSHFRGQWEFEALAENACKVSFWLEFEFKNKLLAIAASKVFELVASEQVKAICERAKQIY